MSHFLASGLNLVTLGAMTTAIMVSGCQPNSNQVTTNPEATASATDIGRRIEILASDNFEGRMPGTKGGQKAKQYIADEMKRAGLQPMGKNGTYFQTVDLTATTLRPESQMTIGTAGGAAPLLQAQNDTTQAVFWTKRLEETISVENSDLIFVGYGITAPEYGWNDYAGLDVTGKTVVMLVNDPGFATQNDALFNGNSMTYYGRWTYKFEEAARQGATAALVIHQTEPASYGWDVVSGSWTGPQNDLVRPDLGASRTALEGWLHEDAARSLFKASGLDFDTLSKRAAKLGFKAVPMEDLQLNAQILQTIETTQSANVAGGITGTTHPDDYVLYMAHWDHLGIDLDAEGDGIFNGAVDNATGTAAILEIGETMVERGAPERSVLILAVTAEESGLLGSSFYSESPLVPLANTVGGINIDALLPVGTTKDVKVIGYGASELEGLLKTQLDKRGMYAVPDDKPQAGYFYRSDHISLAKKGVPMLFSDTGSDHRTKGLSYGENFTRDYTKERYHKPADEYDNSWDLSGIVQITDVLLDMGYDLANTTDWPNWYDGNEFRALRDEMRATSSTESEKAP